MTQTQQILRYLKSGNALTQAQAVRYFNCYRLGARIWDLRRMGIPVKKEMTKSENAHFARYSLC